MGEFVFSTLPPSVDALVSLEDLEAVRGVLDAATGSWITSDRIQTILGWKRQRTAERVRRAVKELQLIGVPIVECHAGFSIATSVSMVDRCLEKELARAAGLARTIEALSRIREHMVTGQRVIADYRQGAAEVSHEGRRPA